MFETLTDKLNTVVDRFRGRKQMTEANIEDALKEVRLSLLEADVNFRVVRQFLASVKEKALGLDVIKSVSPGQQFVKVVYDELVALMGGAAAGVDLAQRPPVVIMAVGLQGSGKTTSLGKLALHLKTKHGRSPYLVPADVYRPAAIDQLTTLARSLDMPVYASATDMDPVDIARDAVARAGMEGADVVLIDTAGRLQIDEELMDELVRIKQAVNPHEILFVADAMTGQEAVNVAARFNELLDVTGFVLTKMDGDARGGAALSIRAVTGKPLKYIGVGEKMDALELFHPDRIASRILGMGDVLTLVERAQGQMEEKQAEELLARMQEDRFSLEDFLVQFERMGKMGPLGDILALLPGIGKQFKELTRGEGAAELDKQIKRFKAIIQSMTKAERRQPSLLDVSHKRRVANGAGVSMEEVNGLLQQYQLMRRMMQQMNKVGLAKMFGKLFSGGGLEDLAQDVSPAQMRAAASGLQRMGDPDRQRAKEKAKDKAREKAKQIKQQKKAQRKKKH